MEAWDRYQAMRPRFSTDWAIWDKQDSEYVHINHDDNHPDHDECVVTMSEDHAKTIADLLNLHWGARG